MAKLCTLLRRAREVWQTEGLFSLLRKVIQVIKPHSFLYKPLFLYENDLAETLRLNKPSSKFDIDNLTTKIIATNKQAEDLEDEEFAFLSYAASDNRDFKYHDKLSKGAIAFCTYVGKDPATIAWAITTKQSLDSISSLSIKVDFSNGEVYVMDFWTNPKHRRKGLCQYNLICNQFPFLMENGTRMVRSCTESSNKPSQSLHEQSGFRKYADGRYMHFLWWKFWKETPCKSR